MSLLFSAGDLNGHLSGKGLFIWQFFGVSRELLSIYVHTSLLCFDFLWILIVLVPDYCQFLLFCSLKT